MSLRYTSDDPDSRGWWLDYIDHHGNELRTAIDGLPHASVADLAYYLDRSGLTDCADGAVSVFTPQGFAFGRVRLRDGRVDSWETT
jgi:hypothetical protein